MRRRIAVAHSVINVRPAPTEQNTAALHPGQSKTPPPPPGDESLLLYDGRTTQWVGPTGDLDPEILQHQSPSRRTREENGIRYISGDPNNPVHFNIVADRDAAPDEPLERGKLLNFQEVHNMYQSHTRRLIDLYFRMVNPTLPIINQGRFLRLYEEGVLSSTPGTLLASMLLAAGRWWSFDAHLSRHQPPDLKPLTEYLQRALIHEVHTPRLVTVQSLLLYIGEMFNVASQKRTLSSSSSGLWALTGMVCLSAFID